MSQKKTLLLLLDEYADKPFGWDGGKELTIRDDVLDLVSMILEHDEFPSSILEELFAVSLTMNGDGSIEIVADNEGRTLGLTFHCDSAISYIQVVDNQGTCMEGVIRIIGAGAFEKALRRIDNLFLWAYAGSTGGTD
jgi:hypothetical protein